MPVFLLPEFLRDLQDHANPHFARRVLRRTLGSDGSFRPDADDHRYEGVDGAWIRYVSAGKTAFRVIYLRSGDKIYLFRAGEHKVEDRLVTPKPVSVHAALPVTDAEGAVAAGVAAIATQESGGVKRPVIHRFRRNIPDTQIHREIFARRNLPHKDIWLVSPFMDGDLFLPTATFGRLLLDQVEDGASVVIVTSAPKDKNIKWMEALEERKVAIFVYPRLHAKLYCFLFDESRRYEPGLPDSHRYSSLILAGSANLTAAGMAVGTTHCNEELCYVVPEDEIGYVETYVTELMTTGYELPDVRRYLARGQWQRLERRRW